MKYKIIKQLIASLDDFEIDNKDSKFQSNVDGFLSWYAQLKSEKCNNEDKIYWEGKDRGRSAESVICTLVNNMSKYAKGYSKSAMVGSNFSTQDEFIFLINLQARGAMTKMELIKLNIIEKSPGMKIIDRLIQHNWVRQTDSDLDKRSKLLEITTAGNLALSAIMEDIRLASKIVVADLTSSEKNILIKTLQKLDTFHNSIFEQSIESRDLLQTVKNNYLNN